MTTTPPSQEAAPSPSPQVQLYAKLLKIGKAISHIEKRGRNANHQYDFVQALDVTREVRRKLHAQKIIVIPSTVPGSVAHHTETGGRSFVTTVDLRYRFVDTETGAEVTLEWTGSGADTGGDKGLYKAYTGGLKYVLMALFLIPATNDPERDGITAPEHDEQAAQAPARQAASPSAGKDSERPAAPRIPRDRARLILEAAKSAGLVRDDDTFGPLLKAKLAELGSEKIGALNVDQAEALEAFIAAEVAQDAAEAAEAKS